MQAQRRDISERRGQTIQFVDDRKLLTFQEVLAGWRDSEGFRDLFVTELAASPYPAFFWEMPPLRWAALTHPFECAVIGSEALTQMQADPDDFADHLNAGAGAVTSFYNLGGDALLIVPRRISLLDCYGHFAAFLREGPREQQHALLQLLAAKAQEMLEAGQKFWTSTSGLGVPWVHVRLDKHPKYYVYRPYAEADA